MQFECKRKSVKAEQEMYSVTSEELMWYAVMTSSETHSTVCNTRLLCKEKQNTQGTAHYKNEVFILQPHDYYRQGYTSPKHNYLNTQEETPQIPFINFANGSGQVDGMGKVSLLTATP